MLPGLFQGDQRPCVETQRRLVVRIEGEHALRGSKRELGMSGLQCAAAVIEKRLYALRLLERLEWRPATSQNTAAQVIGGQEHARSGQQQNLAQGLVQKVDQ